MIGYYRRLKALGLFTHRVLLPGMDLVAPLKDIARQGYEVGGQIDREDGVVLGLTNTDIIDREIVDHPRGKGL
jgi:hypothetical protein